MSKATLLQSQADDLRREHQHDFYIEFRPFKGWYAVAAESRWFGDDGEFLGANYLEAKDTLCLILG